MKTIFNFILIILVIGVLVFPLQKNSTDPYDSIGMRIVNAVSGGSSKTGTDIFGTAGNLVEFTVPQNSTVSGITEVSGILKGSYFFEATARGMLLDANKNVLKTFPLTATGDWQTADGVPFNATIDPSGMPPGPGYIRLANDNPSGDPANDKFIDIPVMFQ